MEKKYVNTVDELGRLLMPSELCSKLGWAKESKLSAQQNTNSVQLTLTPDGSLEYDNLSRVHLNKELREVMGWQESTKIEITINPESTALILQTS